MTSGDTRRLKIGILGVGAEAQWYYLPATKIWSDRLQLKAVRDLDHDRSKHFGELYDADSVFTDYGETLANADINAVAIPTPHERHAEQALLTVGHGKHVYIEKPMDCRRISTDCRFDDHLSGGALGRLTHQDKLREAGLAQCNPPLSSNFNQTSIRGLDDLRRL
jgi:hypothetical protein